MDIKNILNESDRRANSSASPAAPPARTPPSGATSPTHSQGPPAPTVRLDQPALSAMSPVPTMRPSSATPQHIVYTGPVYQLQPAVEVRHMGNTIHYRYAPPYAYDDPAPPLNYDVYQEYSEMPRHPYTRHLDRPASPHRAPAHLDAVPSPPRRPAYSYRPRSPPGPAGRRYANFGPPRAYRRAGLPAAYPPSAHDDLRAPPPPPPADPFVVPQPERFAQHPHTHTLRGRLAHRHPDPYLSYVSYPGPGYEPLHAGYTHHPPDVQSYPSYPPRDRQTDRRPFARPHPTSETRSYRARDDTDHDADMPRRIPFDRDDDDDDDSSRDERHPAAVSSAAPRRSKKRERMSSRPVSSAIHSEGDSDVEIVEDVKGGADLSNGYSHYRKVFRDSSAERESAGKSDPSPSRSVRAKKESRKRVKGGATHITSAWQGEESYARDNVRKKKRAKTGMSPKDQGRPKGKRGKSRSPVSVEDGSSRDVLLKKDRAKESAATSSCNDSDVVVINDDDDAGTVSEHEGESSVDDESVRRRQRDRERYRKSLIARAVDPEEPYPTTFQDFSGIPATAIGDMLQLWEFVNAFSEALRLSSFKLRHLEQAIVHTDRSTLLDACVTRLVRSIIADKDLADELGVADSVIKATQAKGSKNLVANILGSLRHILSFESDEVYDEFLLSTVRKLENSSDKWAFYRVIAPAGRLRILRELVDYAIMTDKIRKCISDSMEHAEEEKKKAREENAANRKKLEIQIKDLKAELLEYRTKNGLLDAPADSDKEKGVQNGMQDAGMTEDTANDSSREGSMSRKDKLLAVQKEKKDEEERRTKERVAESYVARIDKLKAHLKMLKNLRLRNRTSACAKEGDLFDSSAPAPSMPFAAPHEDPVRTHPMGMDREDRRYWFFEGCGRVWIEDTKDGAWCTLNTPAELDRLLRWLSHGRAEEQDLKKRIRQRKELIVSEMANEGKTIELEEAEAQEAQESATEIAPRYTRAGRRKAEKMQKGKTQNKRTGTFLDYRNSVK